MDQFSAQYLRGIELFNAGRFFESHEAFEELWLQSAGIEREFLHALIQTAAALHHLRQGNDKGARNVYARARQRFENSPPVVWGLDIVAFDRELERFFLTAFESRDSQAPFPRIKLQDKQ